METSQPLTTVTHYVWLAKQIPVMLDPNNALIRTIDNIEYEFDITTGDIKFRRNLIGKPNTGNSSTTRSNETIYTLMSMPAFMPEDAQD
jgi:hypothetical protein